MQFMFGRKLTYFLGLILGLTLLSTLGCAPLEHRSEAIKKNPLPNEAKNDPRPLCLWSKKVTQGTQNKDAKLNLAVHQNTLWLADFQGNIYALDSQTGQTKWQEKLNSNITAGPSIRNSLLVVGVGKGEIRALNANDGSLLWQSPVMGEVLGTPAVGPRAVYVNSLDGSITALDKDNGSQLWRQHFQMPTLLLRQQSSPVWRNKRLYVGLSNGWLVSFQEDGKGIWEKEISAPRGHSDIERMVDISADPVVGDDAVYVASYQGNLSRIEKNTGDILWEKPISSSTGLTLDNKSIYTCETDGLISSIGKKSGQVVWQQEILRGRFLTKPVLHGNYVVVGDDEGFLHWLRASDGQYITRIRMDSKGMQGNPIVMDGLLYTLSKSGRVAVYQELP